MRFNRSHAGRLIGVAAFLAGGLALSGAFDTDAAVAAYHGGGYGSSTSTAARNAASGTVEVELSEWDLGFDSVTVEPGKTTFRIVNDGSYEHAFEIEGNGIEKETDRLASGESTTLTVNLEPGEYEVYCPVPGHEPQGMAGEVVVEG